MHSIYFIIAVSLVCRFFINRNDIGRMEAASNTSTVALRVVGGDIKESLKSETVKYGRESHGTRTRKYCADEGQQKL
jgi:hypothetical protein